MTLHARGRILLAEDNLVVQHHFRTVLTNAGYDVVTAADGRQAIQEFNAKAPDLILLDVNMPEGDGLSVLARIRSEHSPLALPVIMCTTESSDDAVEQALAAGANDFLVKPVRNRALLARVQLHLRTQELCNRLAEQEHLAAVAAMVVTYNHEINNPLAIATVHIGLMEGRKDLADEVVKSVGKTKQALERIATIVARTREATSGPIRFTKYVGKTQMVDLPDAKVEKGKSA